MPFISPVKPAAKSGTETPAEVPSLGSKPLIAFKANALSFTVRVNGPIWSRDDAKAIKPNRDTRPYVGFKPTTPLNAAGWRILPPVSLPKETGTSPAATAAAEPPEEPPGTFV